MRLFLDTSRVTFTVTKQAEPKTDNEGRHKADRKTGELLFVVQVMALEEGLGAEVLTITVPGQPPKVSVGQTVIPQSSWKPSRGPRMAAPAWRTVPSRLRPRRR